MSIPRAAERHIFLPANHYFWFDISGESANANKRVLYERDRIAVCSQKRALALALFVFFALFFVALIIAFATPLSGSSLPALFLSNSDQSFD
jgi:hypothetical protein